MANRKLIKDNYDLKLLDGSLAFVDGLNAEEIPQLKKPVKPADYYTLDEETLRADGRHFCDIQEAISLTNESEWYRFKDSVLRPYFDHSITATAVMTAESEAPRQAIISGISPAQLIVQPLIEQDKQFPHIAEFNSFNDKTLRDCGLAWASAIIRNYGILLDERAKATNEGEKKIFNRLWWGLAVIWLLSNVMDSGPLMIWLHEHQRGFPLWHWSPILILCLRVFAVVLTLILAGGLILLSGRCRFVVENRFKALLSAFQNITRQSSLQVGAMMNARRELLDHLHGNLWGAAIMFKEKHWAEDKQRREFATEYRLWTKTRSRCIRMAMWVNGRRKSLDDLLINLHNYILMGYAAQTARAEFKAHFTIISWGAEQGWWRLLFGYGLIKLLGSWGWDRLYFIKGLASSRFWKVFWISQVALLVAAFSIWLLRLHYYYDPVAMSQPGVAGWDWGMLVVKLACIAAPLGFGIHRIYSLVAKLETPDEPALILGNIKGALPDEKYTALRVLEKAVKELVEHDANRLLTEEDKHRG
ncbi:MAG: hypothetical protein NVV72_15525 [Asticcacaulis sp.]|nr:hypothetical protein [Asticcacaulis sp.]